MKVKNHKTLNRYCLRILVQILFSADRQEILTVREIAKGFGYGSANAEFMRSLKELRKAGLIDFEEDKARTITAKCRWEDVSKLSETKDFLPIMDGWYRRSGS